MAKRKIIWTKNSIKERTKIYDYWNNRNKSKEFSKKLHRLFIKSLQPLKTNPELGVLNNELDFRYLIVRHHLIFYNFNHTEIIVLKVCEAHQNPDNLKL